MLVTLTFLPAALALLGRAAYWPSRPKPPQESAEGSGVWRRVAAVVSARPRRTWAVTALLLAGCAAFPPSLSAKGVPLDEIFVDDAPSVAAQRTLGEHFPGGSGNPTIVIADAGRVQEVTAAARGTEGVASAAPSPPPDAPGPAGRWWRTGGCGSTSP